MMAEALMRLRLPWRPRSGYPGIRDIARGADTRPDFG
jgi:hypothetical protein